MATTDIGPRLERAIKAAGVAIVGVSIGDVTNRATWKVQPTNLQAPAQPTIDSFNPDDPAHVTAEKNAEIDGAKMLRAALIATYELKTTVWTQAEFLARVKAIYRTL